MSLYFTLLFALLTLEMAMLFVIVSPLPHRVRKVIYQSYNKLAQNQQFRTIAIILNIIISLLFIDSWKRAQVSVTLYRHQKYDVNQDNERAHFDSHAVTPIQALASRAYNQRNVYISGFILYFMVGIPTVMSIVRRLIKYQDLLNNKGKEPKTENKETDEELNKLKKELGSKEITLEALKNQLGNAEKFFDEKNKPEEITTSYKSRVKKIEKKEI